jgi:hypothetical protein
VSPPTRPSPSGTKEFLRQIITVYRQFFSQIVKSACDNHQNRGTQVNERERGKKINPKKLRLLQSPKKSTKSNKKENCVKSVKLWQNGGSPFIVEKKNSRYPNNLVDFFCWFVLHSYTHLSIQFFSPFKFAKKTAFELCSRKTNSSQQ